MGLDTENSVKSETKSVQNDTLANTNETCNDGKKNAGDQQVQGNQSKKKLLKILFFILNGA